jgi:5-methylthioadenosine/S-adenosylhomocysteine deaminase
MPRMIKGGTIITMDPAQMILEDSAIVWDSERILWIGKNSAIPLEFINLDSYKAKGKVILPGFINLHTHATLSVLRGIGDDTGLAPAYSRNVPQGEYLSADECYLFSLLGGLEALKFGSTCIVDNYVHENETAQAFSDLGVRAVLSERLSDADLFKIPLGIYEFSEKRGDELLQNNLDLISKWEGNPKANIRCRLGPHAPDTCSTRYLEKIRNIADEKKVGLVMHLAQSKREMQEIYMRNAKTPVAYLADLGLLTPNMIVGHCVYVTDADISILSNSGVQISHQSYSNAKEGMVAPIKKLIDNGINVGLGTDNMSGDMIEVMRMALCIGRIQAQNPKAFRALDVLEMATMGGARALGMEAEIGSLKVGKKADIIVVDFQNAHLHPVIDPIANLVYNGLGNDIEAVFVAGEQLIQDGKSLKIDEQHLLSETQKVTKLLWKKMLDE